MKYGFYVKGKIFFPFLILCLSLINGMTATDLVELNIGDKAPQFEGINDANETWKSADVVGKETLVVYFYPAAMTGG